jgi:hypothetical protein
MDGWVHGLEEWIGCVHWMDKMNILWRIEMLLSNARNIQAQNNKTKGSRNPLLGNGSANTPTKIDYRWKRCFLFGPCKMVIRKTIRAIQLVEGWQFSGVMYGRL